MRQYKYFTFNVYKFASVFKNTSSILSSLSILRSARFAAIFGCTKIILKSLYCVIKAKF